MENKNEISSHEEINHEWFHISVIYLKKIKNFQPSYFPISYLIVKNFVGNNFRRH